MAKMMMLIDPSRCTGCRGCQVACKQWNENPAVQTTFRGTYQNPPDFDGDTFTVVRFSEQAQGDYGVYWLLTNDKCRHCADPSCVYALPADSFFIDPSGAVVYKPTAVAAEADVRGSCPFEVPAKNNRSGAITKCTLCFDRTAEGLKPACAHTCPTEAITWGEYDQMLAYAKQRIDWLKANANGRFKTDKIHLYPSEAFASHVRWILLDDIDQHGLKGGEW